MTKIYKDYADEPEDVFLPLPENLACEFYDLEMEAHRDDCKYYDAVLPAQGLILELGCGSGRVSQNLASPSRHMVGLDISRQMLSRICRKSAKNCQFVCSDMTVLPFSDNNFEGLLIPYNTLNLLTKKEQITDCLTDCRRVLTQGHSLHLQLFTPSKEFQNLGKKSFQFKMFESPRGGRIIKEILKKYNPGSQTLEIEERYRVRPMIESKPNEDFNRIYSIAGFPAEIWMELFHLTGFKVIEMFENTGKSPYRSKISTALFAHLQ
jgi:ubiquinone/menaquinone biosynthesis C-methylase UbiE